MPKALYHVGMSFPLFPLSVDRDGPQTLAAQIHGAIRAAILDGRLAPGDRLPSWRDLAARLGVARGTVKAAYERLVDEQLAAGMGAAGTRVSGWVPSAAVSPPGPAALPVAAGPLDQGGAPLSFQMGVPAQDAFPRTVWSRLLARAARDAALAPAGYPDPRGDPVLRREIAASLAIARGVRCAPDQVLITAGYAGALGLAVHALRLWGGTAWMEDPGFPQTRQALELAGMNVVAVPVDGEGLRVADGARLAPDAALVVVTPGQQAPLGMTMSLDRRLALLDWARRRGAWVLEDDYLSELQVKGRAAPALASLDGGLGGGHDGGSPAGAGRVLHAGTFSKTISPALRLGFLVVPPDLAASFAEVAARLAPAPAAPVQRAVAAFMADGHYLRHVRRMKRLYAARRQALVDALTPLAAAGGMRIAATAGLSLVVHLPAGADDVALARRARLAGLAPAPLSPWYRREEGVAGFLLGVTNADERHLAAECRRLVTLVAGG